MRASSCLVVFAASLASAGCLPFELDQQCEAGGVVEEEVPETEAATSRRVAEVLPVEHTAIDLLFVVDDSRSMMDEQEQLGIWSNELFSVLSLEGELPDLHVAVISSSLSIPGIEGCRDGGEGRFHVGEADLGGERFLRDVAGVDGRERNYTGSLEGAFAKMARVGEHGCGFEQPFEATRIALSGEREENAGFLREEALLVVVFVSDEDDCSAFDQSVFTGDFAGNVCSPLGAQSSYRCFEFGVRCADGLSSRELGARSNCRPDEDSAYISSVESFASSLKALKDHPGKVVVAGVYGKPTSVVAERDWRFPAHPTPKLANACESASATAAPGVRINGLLSKFPARAAQSSICEPDLAWAMRNTALLVRGVARKSHCLLGPIADLDETLEGIQPSCSVSSVAAPGSRFETRTPIPPCTDHEDKNCFIIEKAATECAETSSQLAFEVRAPARETPATLAVHCDTPAR